MATADAATTAAATTTSGDNAAAAAASFVRLTSDEKETAIRNFVRYLQFETVSALAVESGAYTKCANWLIEQLRSVPCFHKVFQLDESPDDSPVVVGYIEGADSTLPVLLLNSHYDVVPAPREDWTVEPFQGVRKNVRSKDDDDGVAVVPVIYGRGTQDMKCVSVHRLVSFSPGCFPFNNLFHFVGMKQHFFCRILAGKTLTYSVFIDVGRPTVFLPFLILILLF